MKLKIFFTSACVIVIAIAGSYWYYTYKKTNIINSIKDSITNSVKSSKFIIYDVKIDPDKVIISPWAIVVGKPFDVKVYDVGVGIKTIDGEGVLKLDQISLLYSAFRGGWPQFCSVQGTHFRYADQAVRISFTIDNVKMSPCVELGTSMQPMSMTLSRISFRLESEDNERPTSMNMECNSVKYSLKGSWSDFPQYGENENVNSIAAKIDKWRMGIVDKPCPYTILQSGWEATGLSLIFKDPGEVLNAEVNTATVMAGALIDQEQNIFLDISFGVNNFYVTSNYITASLQAVGLEPHDLFPCSVAVNIKIKELPPELIAASMFFAQQTENGNSNRAVLSYVTLYLMSTLAQKNIPFDIDANFSGPAETHGEASVNGAAGFGGLVGEGSLSLMKLGNVLEKMVVSTRRDIEESIGAKLECDPSYDGCTGRIKILGNKIEVYPFVKEKVDGMK